MSEAYEQIPTIYPEWQQHWKRVPLWKRALLKAVPTYVCFDFGRCNPDKPIVIFYKRLFGVTYIVGDSELGATK